MVAAAGALVSAEAVATRGLNRSQPGPVAMIPSRAVPSSCAPSKAPPISAKDFSVSRTAAFSSAILVLQRRSEARLYRASDPGVAKAFGGPIETAYDAIVGLHDD